MRLYHTPVLIRLWLHVGPFSCVIRLFASSLWTCAGREQKTVDHTIQLRVDVERLNTENAALRRIIAEHCPDVDVEVYMPIFDGIDVAIPLIRSRTVLLLQ